MPSYLYKILRILTSLAFAAALSCTAVHGQQPSSPIEVKGIAGYAGFIDEALLGHFALGAAVRIPLSARWHLEPEILYLRQSSRHDDISISAGAVWTFWRGSRTEAYLVGAGGMLHSRFEFPGALQPNFSSNEFTGGGGAGLRLRWMERLVISPELRIGWEPLLRATIAVGYEFGLR